MKLLPRVLPWFGMVCCLAGLASTPVPPETWAIRESAGAPPCGAVIVSESDNYGNNYSDFDLTIRIYNEAGRAAAELAPFPPFTHYVKGRTVFPDGREVPIDGEKDLARRTIKDGNSEEERTILMPPGVTDDCVVELHWRVDGTYLRNTTLERGLLRPYPIRELLFSLPISTSLGMAVLNSNGLYLQKGVDGAHGTKYWKFTNLPAWESAPYASSALDPCPVMFGFRQPGGMPVDMAGHAPGTFWKEVGPRFLSKQFDELRSGSGYRKLLEEIGRDLPAEALPRARELVARVGEKILNVSRLTLEEKAGRTPAETQARIFPLDLEQTAERRWTSGMGITFLDYRLMQDCQLHPVLLYVADRRVHLFRPGVPSVSQLDGFLLGVRNPDGQGYAWFQTGQRFFPAGIIGESYQGVRGLLVDPETWSTQEYEVPVQPLTLNRRNYDFALTLGEDADLFKVRARFAGYPEYLERTKFLELAAAEQGRKLKGILEQGAGTLSVTAATVNNATSSRASLDWSAEGSREAGAGRRRLVEPFPGMPAPLWLPPSWPQKRTRNLILPVCQTTRAVSRFKVPPGWKLKEPPESHEGNSFGSVDWSVKLVQEGDATVAEVEYQVVLERSLASYEDYAGFLAFMGWLQKGWRMQVELEKAG